MTIITDKTVDPPSDEMLDPSKIFRQNLFQNLQNLHLHHVTQKSAASYLRRRRPQFDREMSEMQLHPPEQQEEEEEPGGGRGGRRKRRSRGGGEEQDEEEEGGGSRSDEV